MGIKEYVSSIHAACELHDRSAQSRAQSKLRELEKLRVTLSLSVRPAGRGVPRRSAVAAWDRLRAAGLLPAPRRLPAARDIPDTSLPAWMAGLREDELGAAWIASAEYPAADAERWRSRAKSIARDDRAGRYGSHGRGRSRAPGVSPYAADDESAVRDWLARDRDTLDGYDIFARRLVVLRDHLGNKLADAVASGMTQTEAAVLCGVSVATVERRLASARRLVASVL